MNSTIRWTLWGAFTIVILLIAAGVALTVPVLQSSRLEEYNLVHGSEPLLDAVRQMDGDVVAMLGAGRGFLLTQQTRFLQQYDGSVRDFEKQRAAASQLASSPSDVRLVAQLRQHFAEIRGLTDREIAAMKQNQPTIANNLMLQAAAVRRSAPDFAGTLADRYGRRQTSELEQMNDTRQGLTTLMVVIGIAIIILGTIAVWRIEQSLRASIARQIRRTEEMIAGMSDGVMLIDGNGTSVFINPAGQRILGQTRTGVSIDQQAEVYRLRTQDGEPIDAKELPAAQAIATGKPVEDKTIIVARDDKQIAISTSATPLKEDSRITGVIVTFRDVTERQRLLAERAALAIENAKLYTEQVEARRKMEDLSRLKDEFLSIASHELRTPVTSIKGYTQLAKTLIRENDLPASEEYLDIALDQIDRMSRLILELLDVSRIETGRLEIRHEQIDWVNFVRDLVHRHHTAVSDRRFHVDVPEAGAIVTGDRDRLEQVLGNLLENAVKYSPDGSEVTVRVEPRDDQVITTVSDRGMGIPADEVGQVFERFHRGRQVSSTNYGGLGLGLYITKQIVERHGGSIWVDSEEGVGTSFSFALPLVPNFRFPDHGIRHGAAAPYNE